MKNMKRKNAFTLANAGREIIRLVTSLFMLGIELILLSGLRSRISLRLFRLKIPGTVSMSLKLTIMLP
jgi:hypothetical protein